MGKYQKALGGIGKDLATIYSAYAGEKKKKQQKEGTLAFFDQLEEILGLGGDQEDILDLAGGGPEPAGDPDDLGVMADFLDFGEMEESQELPVGAAGIPDEGTNTPGMQLTDKGDRDNEYRARQTMDMYRALFEQDEIDPGAIGAMKDISGILSPRKTSGLSYEERRALEEFKGGQRSEFEGEKQSNKMEMLEQKHKAAMEKQKRGFDYRASAQKRSTSRALEAIKLKKHGLDLLDEVKKGRKGSSDAISELDESIADMQEDVTGMKEELNEYEIDSPDVANTTRIAIRELEESVRELKSARRRIRNFGGKSEESRGNTAEKMRLQGQIQDLQSKQGTANADQKKKIEQVIRILQKKIKDLE